MKPLWYVVITVLLVSSPVYAEEAPTFVVTEKTWIPLSDERGVLECDLLLSGANRVRAMKVTLPATEGHSTSQSDALVSYLY